MSAEINIIGCLDSSYESSSRVYCYDGLCPTLNTMGGGNRQPMIIDFAKTTRGSDVVSTIRVSYYKNGERNIEENVVSGKGYEGVVESRIVAMRGRNPDHPTDRTPWIPTEQRFEPAERGIVNTLTSVQKDNLVLEKKQSLQYRIRKLTERECWRLMDFPDSDFDKAAEVESRTQLYKQAGNAIVRAVLMALFLQMNIQGIKNWNDRTEEEKGASIDNAGPD